MRTSLLAAAAALAAVVAAPFVPAADPPRSEPPPGEPRPIPLTRPEMKQFLEDMKQRKPRIPLPELTAEDKAKLGDRGQGYEARLRYHYMPYAGDGRTGGGFGFGPAGTEATVDNTLKVQLFWIVSRVNNCQYCQGHQESKLLRAGQKEDEIAGLDGDWSEFTPAQRTAFAFARTFTYTPHLLGDADIDAMRKHYKDLEILEMVLSMAGNNAINRWKEGTGVPQSEGGGGFGKEKEPTTPPAKHTYLTPTAEKNKTLVTKVAPLTLDKNQPTRQTVCVRPALESRAETEKALAAARARKARLPLVEDAKAREIVPEGFPKGELPGWVRLLANFPTQGKGRVATQVTAEEKGDLKPLLKAQAAWVIARQDRAWYAAGEAKKRLLALGQTEDQIYALDGDWKGLGDADRAMLTLAKKLAASPVVLTDDDVSAAVKLTSPRDVTQLIHYVTLRASFDRITEAAGLRLEK